MIVEREIAAAERKAWDSLARYKFWMFGYHAAQWVLLTRVSGIKRPNPFRELVKLAKTHPKESSAEGGSPPKNERISRTVLNPAAAWPFPTET